MVCVLLRLPRAVSHSLAQVWRGMTRATRVLCFYGRRRAPANFSHSPTKTVRSFLDATRRWNEWYLPFWVITGYLQVIIRSRSASVRRTKDVPKRDADFPEQVPAGRNLPSLGNDDNAHSPSIAGTYKQAARTGIWVGAPTWRTWVHVRANVHRLRINKNSCIFVRYVVVVSAGTACI